MLETDILNLKRLTTNPFIPRRRCTKILGLSSYYQITLKNQKTINNNDLSFFKYHFYTDWLNIYGGSIIVKEVFKKLRMRF